MGYALKKRMAKGGDVKPMAAAEGGECQACRGGSCMAHGGDVVDRILKRMSEGGMVANDTDDDRADTDPAQFDDLVARDDLAFAETGANSGDSSGATPGTMDDDDDIVSRIMKRMSQKVPRTGQPGYPE